MMHNHENISSLFGEVFVEDLQFQKTDFLTNVLLLKTSM